MSTRIFKVEYWLSEYYDGRHMNDYKETKSFVAKDAAAAIQKAKTAATKTSFTKKEDEDGKPTKEKIKVTYGNFDPINVTLTAEAE